MPFRQFMPTYQRTWLTDDTNRISSANWYRHPRIWFLAMSFLLINPTWCGPGLTSIFVTICAYLTFQKLVQTLCAIRRNVTQLLQESQTQNQANNRNFASILQRLGRLNRPPFSTQHPQRTSHRGTEDVVLDMSEHLQNYSRNNTFMEELRRIELELIPSQNNTRNHRRPHPSNNTDNSYQGRKTN